MAMCLPLLATVAEMRSFIWRIAFLTTARGSPMAMRLIEAGEELRLRLRARNALVLQHPALDLLPEAVIERHPLRGPRRKLPRLDLLRLFRVQPLIRLVAPTSERAAQRTQFFEQLRSLMEWHSAGLLGVAEFEEAKRHMGLM